MSSEPSPHPSLPSFSLKRTSYSTPQFHYGDVIMGTVAYQITSLTIVYSTVYSGADQRKHQSSASLACVRWIHRGPVNSPHKWPVTRKTFPSDDVIMCHKSTSYPILNLPQRHILLHSSICHESKSYTILQFATRAHSITLSHLSQKHILSHSSICHKKHIQSHSLICQKSSSYPIPNSVTKTRPFPLLTVSQKYIISHASICCKNTSYPIS